MPLIDSFKAGDTEPELTHTIEGLAQDASNINDVILYMSPEDEDGLQINNSVDDFSPANDGDAVSIEYQLSSTETSISDRHQIEFVVEYTDNLHETFPKSGFWSIQVSEPLERDGDPIEIQTDHDMDRLGVDELDSQSGNGVSVTDNFDFGGNNVSGVGSLGVGSLENGVAGDGNEITSIADNEGEYRLVTNLTYLPGERASTSSTDWEEPGDGVNDRLIPNWDWMGINTNIESDIYLSLTARIQNGEGAIRARDLPASELHSSDFEGFNMDGDPVVDDSGNSAIGLEIMSADGNTAEFVRMNVQLWERIA